MSHAPRPYGLHLWGDDPLDVLDMHAIDGWARRVSLLKSAGRLEGLQLRRVLPSGRVVRAVDQGGVFRVHVWPKAGDSGFPEHQGDSIPMFFSGVLVNGRSLGGAGIELELTRQCRDRLRGYDKTAPLPAAKQWLKRFRIDVPDIVSELAPTGESVAFFSQLMMVWPSWYSGSAGEVAQLALGYGIQDFASLPNNSVERAVLQIPAPVHRKINEQMRTLPENSPFDGAPPKNGQLQLDYKFKQSDGVVFGADKAPWLVRFNKSGVYAMPLPLIPKTRTQAFKRWMEEVQDTEILHLLNRYGGIPSAVGFPASDADLAAWVRAGVIQRVGAASDFYDHQPLYDACGWSFKRTGAEAVNTCMSYGEDGVLNVMMYQALLELPKYKVRADSIAAGAQISTLQRPSIAQYIGRLRKNIHPASLYKITHGPLSALQMRLSSTNVEREIEFWDQYELKPENSGSVSCRRAHEGRVWHPAKKLGQPQIKFPDAKKRTCLSMDLSAQEGVPKPDVDRCDTVIHAFYQNDDLQVVKYFYDSTARTKPDESNFEQCMTVGSWYKIEYKAPATIHGNFYTTEHDDREELPDSRVETQVVGKDLGYDTFPFIGFDQWFGMAGSIFRNRYFTTQTKRKSIYLDGSFVALMVPVGVRDGVIEAWRKVEREDSRIESLYLDAVPDPNVYRMWTYDEIFHYRWDFEKPMKGTPFPRNSAPVWVEYMRYEDGPCSDFADQGAWMGSGFPMDRTDLLAAAQGRGNTGGGGPPSVHEYSVTFPETTSSTDVFRMCVEHPSRTYAPKGLKLTDRHFEASPNKEGETFGISGVSNMAGEAVFSCCDEEIDAAFVQQGFTRMGKRNVMPLFGVVNE